MVRNRDALEPEEFIALAASIGVIGNAKLRESIATETWHLLQRHKIGTYGESTSYDRETWFHLCRIDAPFEL
jgi:hypothetical protein